MSLSVILMGAMVVVAIMIGAALAAKRGKAESGTEAVWPFYVKKPLSMPEQVLYFRLVKALPQHIVLAQVQLSRILGVRTGNNFGQWHNRINRMSVDYVICGKDLSVVAVIELDDASHQKALRKVADAKKDRALRSANVPIYRFQAKQPPDDQVILALFGQQIEAAQDALGSI